MSQDGELRRGERDRVPTDRGRAFNIENLEKGFQSSIKKWTKQCETCHSLTQNENTDIAQINECKTQLLEIEREVMQWTR